MNGPVIVLNENVEIIFFNIYVKTKTRCKYRFPYLTTLTFFCFYYITTYAVNSEIEKQSIGKCVL